MKNKNKTVWSKRLKGNVSKSFQRIGSSINVDKRLYKQDIAASRGRFVGLYPLGLLADGLIL